VYALSGQNERFVTEATRTNKTNSELDVFECELDDAFEVLRSAVGALFVAIDADPDKPQDLSRRLGINKNLAWKASRIVGAESPAVGIPHLPGTSGLDLLLDAFAHEGASPVLIRDVRRARNAFEAFIEEHAGDRATLDLMLDSMGAGWNSDRLEMSRRLAFQGNSGLWGIQCGMRFSTTILAPNAADSSLLDITMFGVYIDIRRLRPGVTWPMFVVKAEDDAGESIPLLDDRTDAEGEFPDRDGTRLLRRFCSSNMPEILIRKVRNNFIYEFDQGPVGNTGVFDCAMGTRFRGVAPRYRTGSDSVGRLSSHVLIPSERMVLDLLVHRDLPYSEHATKCIYPLLGDPSTWTPPWMREDPHSIPIEEPLHAIDARHNAIEDPALPRQGEVLETVLKASGWRAEDFCGLRLDLKYPPMPSLVVIEWPLPESPVAGV